MVDEEPASMYGVVGLGEVGLPLCLLAAEARFDVLGADIDADKVDQIERGESYIPDVDDTDVAAAVETRLSISTEYGSLSDATHIAVCVPTPLQKSGQPDISYVADAVQDLTEVISARPTVIIKNTMYHGATENPVTDVLEEKGFTVGENVYLGSHPNVSTPETTSTVWRRFRRLSAVSRQLARPGSEGSTNSCSIPSFQSTLPPRQR